MSNPNSSNKREVLIALAGPVAEVLLGHISTEFFSNLVARIADISEWLLLLCLLTIGTLVWLIVAHWLGSVTRAKSLLYALFVVIFTFGYYSYVTNQRVWCESIYPSFEVLGSPDPTIVVDEPGWTIAAPLRTTVLVTFSSVNSPDNIKCAFVSSTATEPRPTRTESCSVNYDIRSSESLLHASMWRMGCRSDIYSQTLVIRSLER